MAEIDLTKMSSAELVEALIKDNSLASEFDRLNLWGKFDRSNWTQLLSTNSTLWIYYPDITVKEIKKEPTKANECKCWNRFSALNWSNLLSTQPQFADRCDKWNNFNATCWSQLLLKQPQFADKCDRWHEFNFHDWKELLSKQPQFKTKCKISYEINALNHKQISNYKEKPKLKNEWDTLNIHELYFMIKEKPELIKKCPNNKREEIFKLLNENKNGEPRERPNWFLLFETLLRSIKEHEDIFNLYFENCLYVDNFTIEQWYSLLKTNAEIIKKKAEDHRKGRTALIRISK